MNKFTKVEVASVTDEAEAKVVARNVHHKDSSKGDEGVLNQNVLIGVLLQGINKDVPVLVTYNASNNTFQRDYNNGIISEEDIVEGLWAELTPAGQNKLRNLTRFYAEKMPEHLRALRDKLRGAPAPTDNLLDYDLDLLETAAIEEAEVMVPNVPKAVLADLGFVKTNAYQLQHALMEAALVAGGFSFELRSENGVEKVYDATLNGNPFNSMRVQDLGTVQSLNELLGECVAHAGWVAEEGRFPLLNGDNALWSAHSHDGKLGVTLDLAAGTCEFKILPLGA